MLALLTVEYIVKECYEWKTKISLCSKKIWENKIPVCFKVA